MVLLSKIARAKTATLGVVGVTLLVALSATPSGSLFASEPLVVVRYLPDGKTTADPAPLQPDRQLANGIYLKMNAQSSLRQIAPAATQSAVYLQQEADKRAAEQAAMEKRAAEWRLLQHLNRTGTGSIHYTGVVDLNVSRFITQVPLSPAEKDAAREKLRAIYDEKRAFEPFAGSRIAISPDGRWLAAVGVSVHRGLQDNDRLELVIAKEHRRILLYDLKQLAERMGPLSGVPLLDTYDCLVELKRGGRRLPLDNDTLRSGARLKSQFDRNASEDFDWRGGDIEISFAADSKNLFVRVYTDAMQTKEFWLGGKYKVPTPAGARRDLGAARMFKIALFEEDYVSAMLGGELKDDDACEKLPIYRTIVPDSPFIDRLALNTNKVTDTAGQVITYSLAPGGRYYAMSILERVSRDDDRNWKQRLEIWEANPAGSCEGAATALGSTSPDREVCRSRPVAHSVDRVDSFYLPDLRWMDGHLVVKSSNRDYQVVSLGKVGEAIRTGRSPFDFDASKQESKPLDLTPTFTTTNPQTWFAGLPNNMMDRRQKYWQKTRHSMRLQVGEAVFRYPHLVAIDQLPIYTPTFVDELSDLDRFAGMATVYSVTPMASPPATPTNVDGHRFTHRAHLLNYPQPSWGHLSYRRPSIEHPQSGDGGVESGHVYFIEANGIDRLGVRWPALSRIPISALNLAGSHEERRRPLTQRLAADGGWHADDRDYYEIFSKKAPKVTPLAGVVDYLLAPELRRPGVIYPARRAAPTGVAAGTR